jgi:hypothetical protein
MTSCAISRGFWGEMEGLKVAMLTKETSRDWRLCSQTEKSVRVFGRHLSISSLVVSENLVRLSSHFPFYDLSSHPHLIIRSRSGLAPPVLTVNSFPCQSRTCLYSRGRGYSCELGSNRFRTGGARRSGSGSGILTRPFHSVCLALLGFQHISAYPLPKRVGWMR